MRRKVLIFLAEIVLLVLLIFPPEVVRTALIVLTEIVLFVLTFPIEINFYGPDISY
jgi:hypothetical protein